MVVQSAYRYFLEGSLPFQMFSLGFIRRWICEINSTDLRNIPCGVSGSFSLTARSVMPENTTLLTLMFTFDTETLKKKKKGILNARVVILCIQYEIKHLCFPKLAKVNITSELTTLVQFYTRLSVIFNRISKWLFCRYWLCNFLIEYSLKNRANNFN